MQKTLVKYWFLKYLLVFGGCWLLLEPAGLFFKPIQNLGWLGFWGITGFALIVTLLLFRQKKSVSVYLPESNFKITVTESDVLDQTGSIVIGTCDTFDTELGELISPNSVQGQFQIKIYHSDKNALDSDIDNALNGTPNSYLDDTKSSGKKIRFPIGTVACVNRNNNRYFLLAFTKMLSGKNRVTTDIKDFWASLIKCWEAVRENGHLNNVHIPVIGTKFARTGLSLNIVIQLIIMSFIMSSKTENIAPSLTVHVHNSDSKRIDYISLNNWLKGIAGKL